MDDRESTLLGLGVALNTGQHYPGVSAADSPGPINPNAQFTGYGAFTPITVSPHSELRNANVAGDKRRD
jgi:hypothetical protein